MKLDEFASEVKLAYVTLKCIWEKAESLIKGENIVVRIGQKAVTVSCDKECVHYRSIGICSHLVAVVEKQNCLTDFAKLFVKKKRNHTRDFALTGMPGGRNQKGGIPPRKRKSKIPPPLLPHTPNDSRGYFFY